jgi:hypothetical protein
MPSEPNDVLPTTETRSPSNASMSKTQIHWQSTWSHLQTEISLEHADIPIIACCFVSGICDSSAYNAWTCFVSMQTGETLIHLCKRLLTYYAGNTMFLALGASGQPLDHPYGWAKSLLSVFCFFMGCLFFSNTRLINPKARGTLGISFLLQSICIIVAAALVQAHVVPEPHGLITEMGTVHFIELIPLGFLAFQSGGQIATSRLLGFNEVPTTVLTSVYCDLASDPKLLKADNVKRNRRVAAVVTLLLGGIAGGWISRSKAGLSTSLWIAAAIKLGIACSWSVWKPKQPIQL